MKLTEQAERSVNRLRREYGTELIVAELPHRETIEAGDLNLLAHELGYGGIKGMLNDLNWWGLTLGEFYQELSATAQAVENTQPE